MNQPVAEPAAYLTRVKDTVTLNIYNVGNEPKHLQAPANLQHKPNDVQLWAEEELAARGLYVKDWSRTPEGWDDWDGEYDFKASMEALPPQPERAAGIERQTPVAQVTAPPSIPQAPIRTR